MEGYKEEERGKEEGDRRLTLADAEGYMRKYEDLAARGILSEDAEFFIVNRSDGSKLSIPKWKYIPTKEDPKGNKIETELAEALATFMQEEDDAEEERTAA